MPEPKQISLPIEGMSCASCVGRVERALLALPGVDEVNVNLAAETAQARIDSDARIPEVIGALEHAGYPARTQTARLNVSSMSCASCVGRVDKALAAVPGVLDVDVNLAPDLATAQRLLAEIQDAVEHLHGHGHAAVLLVPTDIRFALFRFVSRFLTQVQVLGQNELPGRVELVTETTIDAVVAGQTNRAAKGPAA